MATNPIRQIQATDLDHVAPASLRDIMRQLAALPPSVDIPYLTVTLDWRVDGADPGVRPGHRQGERDLTALVDAFAPRGPAFESLQADAARVRDFLERELDPAAQGVVIIAQSASGLFEPVPLPLPVPTTVMAAPTPSLRALAHLVEDYPLYGVLVADQRVAFLTLFALEASEHTITIRASDYPRKQQTGGWSQRRFQARADERVNAFARGVAGEVLRALEETDAHALIIAGDEIFTSAFEAVAPPQVRDLTIARIRLDINATEPEIIAATAPLAENLERQREEHTVQRVLGGVPSGNALTGASAVIRALQEGRVATLVLVDDVQLSGWADFSLGVFGAGTAPTVHPAGGDVRDIVSIDLADQMIRLALLTSAEIEIIHSRVPVDPGSALPEPGTSPPRSSAAQALDALGGVGVMLRFATA